MSDAVHVIEGPQRVDRVHAADEVEVWCGFTGRWVRGFRIAARLPDGSFELFGRDRDDRLPEPLPAHLVRPAGPQPVRC